MNNKCPICGKEKSSAEALGLFRELARQLPRPAVHQARPQGQRTDLDTKVSKLCNWGGYCEEIGSKWCAFRNTRSRRQSIEI